MTGVRFGIFNYLPSFMDGTPPFGSFTQAPTYFPHKTVTYCIFATFADVARHVCMLVWQQALEPLQKMQTDQFTPVASLSQLADAWPHMSGSLCGRPRFNTQ